MDWLREGVAAATNELAIGPGPSVTFFCGAPDLCPVLTYITLVALPSPVENQKLKPTMSFHHPSHFDNPSSSYLNEEPYGNKADWDEDTDYAYPPRRQSEFYSNNSNRKPYHDAKEQDYDTEFSSSQQALSPARAQDYSRSCFQRYLPNSMACRLYLLAVLIQTAIDVCLEADILIQFGDLPSKAGTQDETENQHRLPVYLGIFAFAHMFQFILAIDAVIFRNTLQFIFLVLFNGALLLYAGIQISEIRDIFPPNKTGVFSKIPITVLTDIIPVVIGVAEIVYIGLGWKIYTEFGWKVYKLLGADRQIKKMYAQYQVFECLLKFDVFFWLGFSIQFLGLVLNHNGFEFPLTIAALPLSMLLLIQGFLAARYESKWMMWSFLAGLTAGFAYFSYKLVTIVIRRNDSDIQPVWKTLSSFTALSDILLIATFVWAVMVMLNFDRGLKTQLDKSRQRKAGVTGQLPRPMDRMSID